MEAQIKASKDALLTKMPTSRKDRKKLSKRWSSAKMAIAIAANFANGARTALALDPSTTLASALPKVLSSKGSLNWLLVTPTLELIDAGAGSVVQMRTFLKARV